MIGWTFGNCVIEELLGQGATSRVFRVTDNDSGLACALKYMSKHENDEEMLSKTKGMVELTKPFDYPFICKTYDSFETDAAYAVQCELCEGGNLMDYISRERQLSEDMSRKIFYELMLALKFLHGEANMLHRDLKLENILLDRWGHVRLGDFGLSAHGGADTPLKRTRCGTPAYAAPEVIKEDAYYSKADIWSAGVILYTMVAGAPPFSGSNVGELFHAVVTQELTLPDQFSMELKDLLKHILEKDAEQRYAIHEIMTHPWVSSCPSIGKLELDAIEKTTRTIQADDAVIVAVAEKLGLDAAKAKTEIQSGNVNCLPRRVYRILRNDARPQALVQLAGEVVPGGITLPQKVQANRRPSGAMGRGGRGGMRRGMPGGGKVPGRPRIGGAPRPGAAKPEATWDESGESEM